MQGPNSDAKRQWWRPELLLVLGALFGLAARLPGLTMSSGLFRDDAWVAAPSTVSFSRAADLVSTFPGFSLGIWPLLHLTAPTTLYAQSPALLAGLLGLPALWWMLRGFKLPAWPSAVVSVAIWLSPVVITYSTRVKPYTTELLLAAILLGVTARIETRSNTRWWLALSSVIAFGSSFSLTPVIVGCWAAVLVDDYRAAKTFKKSFLPLLVSAVAVVSLLLIFWKPVPPSLHAFWSPFFVNWSSPGGFARSLQHILGGFSAGLTGAPALTTNHLVVTGIALTILGSLLALLGIGMRELGSRSIAPSVALLLAVLLSAFQIVPLGTGRTDEVMYPAVAILLAAGLTQLLSLKMPRVRQVVLGLSAGVLVVVLALAPTIHRSDYPVSDLNGAMKLATTLPDSGDAIQVFDAGLRYNFAWSGYLATSDGVPPHLVITSSNEAGYTVRLPLKSTKTLFVASSDLGDSTYHPNVWVQRLDVMTSSQATPQLLFFGLTEQVVNPTTGPLPGQANDPHRSPFFHALMNDGWKVGAITVGRGVYAQILTKQ
ncbi:MAG: hypothetical protein WCL38_00785 [Actinomycetota bacterium]